MFSSAGFLKGAICPYYANGLCERPYCHFKHSKPEPKPESQQTINKEKDSTPSSFKNIQVYRASNSSQGSSHRGQSGAKPGGHSLLNAVGRALKQVQRDVDKARRHNAHRRNEANNSNKWCAPLPISSSNVPQGYQPTKISNLKPASPDAYSPKRITQSQPLKCGTPSYIPTKINRSQSTDHDPTVNNLVYSPSVGSRKSLDLYQPSEIIPVDHHTYEPPGVSQKKQATYVPSSVSLVKQDTYEPPGVSQKKQATYVPSSVSLVKQDTYEPPGVSQKKQATYVPSSVSLVKQDTYEPPGVSQKKQATYVPSSVSQVKQGTYESSAIDLGDQTVYCPTSQKNVTQPRVTSRAIPSSPVEELLESIVDLKARVSPTLIASEKPSYVPTPISDISSAIEKSDARTSPTTAKPVVYVPTKISQLNKANKPVPKTKSLKNTHTADERLLSLYKPTPIDKLGDGKYKMEYNPQILKNDLEYDPGVNFTIHQKVKGHTQSSERRMVDGSPEAKFSDDEDEIDDKKTDTETKYIVGGIGELNNIEGDKQIKQEKFVNDTHESNVDSVEQDVLDNVKDTVTDSRTHAVTCSKDVSDPTQKSKKQSSKDHSGKEKHDSIPKDKTKSSRTKSDKTDHKSNSSTKKKLNSSTDSKKESITSKEKSVSSSKSKSKSNSSHLTSSSKDQIKSDSKEVKNSESSKEKGISAICATGNAEKSLTKSSSKSSTKEKHASSDKTSSSSSKDKSSAHKSSKEGSKSSESKNQSDKISQSSKPGSVGDGSQCDIVKQLKCDKSHSENRSKHKKSGSSKTDNTGKSHHDKHGQSDSRSKSSKSSSKSTDHKSNSNSDGKMKHNSSKSRDAKPSQPKGPKENGGGKRSDHNSRKGSFEVFNDLFGDESESDSIVQISTDDEKTNLMKNNRKRHLSELSDNEDDDEDDDDLLPFNDYPMVDADVSDDDTYDECLKIFNANKGSAKEPSLKKIKTEVKELQGPLPGAESKSRQAHQLTPSGYAKKIAAKPYGKLSPAQVMHNRMVAMQQQVEANKLKTANVQSSQSAPGGVKRRISALSTNGSSPGSSLLKKRARTSTEPEPLVISTHDKGTKRVARVSAKVVSKRPTIPLEYGSKVPITVRQMYLNKIIDECLKMYDDDEDAYQRALNEERTGYERSSSRGVYLNVNINTIKRLRNEVATSQQRKSTPAKVKNVVKKQMFSHQALLGGAKAAKTSFSIQHKSKVNNSQLTEDGFYKCLENYLLSESQLLENGFPRINTDKPGAAIVQKYDKDKAPTIGSDPNEKLCVRCGSAFVVYRDGSYKRREECIHHWGKYWKRKVNGALEHRFTCCEGDFASPGCQVGKCHVFDDNKLDTHIGFVRTLPSSPPPGGNYKVYAMDCEMVYTTGGIELARVTVIDYKLQSVYECTVQPSHEIVDCNTRFSGLTDKDFKNVTTKLRDVQAVLLSMFNDRTILIGHSLESDLLSLKLIHSTVVDTSVVFPHRLGPPYKRALKTLMIEFLQKIIQDDVGGHDSQEDAQACMELMLWKIKEDAKKKQNR